MLYSDKYPIFAAMNGKLLLALKGAAMGIAEVIPGVSGGTIAFITGIYEKLLDTIKAFSPALIKTYKQDGVRAVWEAVNGEFLISLMIGMVFGVVIGVFGITYLLHTYPVYLWSFFFGLIIASSIYISRHVEKWNWVSFLALAAGTAIAYYISVAAPAQGNHALWFVFVAGAIAISALILPGISGSFMLLLMGMYTFIIPAVKDALKTFSGESLTVLAVFAAGCVVGLATFSRVLSWTFKHYKSQTMALLTGFMVGSLNKIWPWRNVLTTRTNSRGEVVPFLEKSVLPANFDGEPYVTGAIIMMVTGFLIVFVFDYFDNKK